MCAAGSCLVTYEAANDGSVTDEHAYFETALKLKGQCDIMVSSCGCTRALVPAALAGPPHTVLPRTAHTVWPCAGAFTSC